MSVDIGQVLYALNVEVPQGGAWVTIPCPFHDDSRASARVSLEEDKFFCHGCDTKGNGEEIKTMIEKNGDTVNLTAAPPKYEQTEADPQAGMPRPLPRIVAEDLEAAVNDYVDQGKDSVEFKKYWTGRGFTKEDALANRIGYVAQPHTGHELYRGRMSIPYLTPSGTVTVRFRALDGREPKYLGTAGPTRLFGAMNIVNPFNEVIAITEGEIDALTLTKCGLPAVGIPGANAWKRHFGNLFDGFSHIFVVADGDQAGRQFVQRVLSSLPYAHPIYIKEGEDVNSLFTKYGQEAVINMFKLEELRR